MYGMETSRRLRWREKTVSPFLSWAYINILFDIRDILFKNIELYWISYTCQLFLLWIVCIQWVLLVDFLRLPWRSSLKRALNMIWMISSFLWKYRISPFPLSKIRVETKAVKKRDHFCGTWPKICLIWLLEY